MAQDFHRIVRESSSNWNISPFLISLHHLPEISRMKFFVGLVQCTGQCSLLDVFSFFNANFLSFRLIINPKFIVLPFYNYKNSSASTTIIAWTEVKKRIENWSWQNQGKFDKVWTKRKPRLQWPAEPMDSSFAPWKKQKDHSSPGNSKSTRRTTTVEQ